MDALQTETHLSYDSEPPLLIGEQRGGDAARS